MSSRIFSNIVKILTVLTLSVQLQILSYLVAGACIAQTGGVCSGVLFFYLTM